MWLIQHSNRLLFWSRLKKKQICIVRMLCIVNANISRADKNCAFAMLNYVKLNREKKYNSRFHFFYDIYFFTHRTINFALKTLIIWKMWNVQTVSLCNGKRTFNWNRFLWFSLYIQRTHSKHSSFKTRDTLLASSKQDKGDLICFLFASKRSIPSYCLQMHFVTFVWITVLSSFYY